MAPGTLPTRPPVPAVAPGPARVLTRFRHRRPVECRGTQCVSGERCRVTDVKELDEQIAEALALIDRGLGDMLHRELVSTDEVADLLLDVRSLLTIAEPVAN